MNVKLRNEDAPRLVGEAEFARSIGWSAGSVAKAVSAGTLFVVKQGGQQLYPSFFADGTLKRRQLIAVSRMLKDLDDGFTKYLRRYWQFEPSLCTEIKGTPSADGHRAGGSNAVAAAAAALRSRWWL
jgi:hypothetical protein